MNDLPVTLHQLSARLENLEQRIHRLEHPADAFAAPVEAETQVASASQSAETSTYPQAAGMFPVLGKSLLGIAGAYLLRALAESTSLSKTALATIAIAYALIWLASAVRVQKNAWLPAAIYSGTSALILVPMLWELTLTFKVTSPAVAAAVLALFVLAAFALAWKRDIASILWIVNPAAAMAAIALAIATRALTPFLAVLLLMSLASEYSSIRRHARGVQSLVAIAAALGVAVSIFIYSGPQSTRPEYPSLDTLQLLAPACALFILYALSIAIRTAFMAQTITIFETLQVTIAFALATVSVLTFAPQFFPIAFGVACLFLSAACDAIVLTLERKCPSARNSQVFAAWATTLLIAGAILCLPPFAQSLCLGFTAIAFALLGVRLKRITPQVHGLVLLIAAAIVSGLQRYDFHSLAGSLPSELKPGACLAALCVIGCYAISMRLPGHARVSLFLQLIPAALLGATLTAMLVRLLSILVDLRIVAAVQHIAFIRTFSATAVALVLAFAAARWRRPELKIIAYAALVFVASKLLFEDLRHGHFEFIAASIFLFAISLIIVPRLAPIGHKT